MDYKPVKAWALIFLSSKANGGIYTGDCLTVTNWDWPKDTYLQRRLKELREQKTEGERE